MNWALADAGMTVGGDFMPGRYHRLLRARLPLVTLVIRWWTFVQPGSALLP